MREAGYKETIITLDFVLAQRRLKNILIISSHLPVFVCCGYNHNGRGGATPTLVSADTAAPSAVAGVGVVVAAVVVVAVALL